MSNIDSTVKEFKFPSSSIDLSSEESIKSKIILNSIKLKNNFFFSELHDLHASFDDSMILVKYMIDYICLLSKLKSRTKII